VGTVIQADAKQETPTKFPSGVTIRDRSLWP